eukprot:CAMPEP_0179250626 /NCGR_PEP_ID=MMETSP0797-20121207/21267_1 /TAXON_ID=47934 /ORGANISM="Dinophysis acuminata, Strain DAEP01" /LENGTH=458 /DNA_ID=CAMNT_0020958373 /DNA_START=63 /DNA_END=1437 /DNA_ORIENTATION=-
MSLPKGPAQQQLDRLDEVFGPEYFEHGRLILTVARDIAGMMKIAHKIQSRVHSEFGAVVEVIIEHVKHEWWAKLHETTTTLGMHKGPEVPECQVTEIPEGIRMHPYKREHLPTLEVLLLWEDLSRVTRGHCIYSVAHPDTPSLEQVDSIFAEIEPYFAKRWLVVELQMAPPIRGEFEEHNEELADEIEEDTHVGRGVGVTVLACHAYGFAREPTQTVAHAMQCQPVSFKSVTDDASKAKLCFLPADINKIQVSETERFHGTETILPKADVRHPQDGPTIVKINLTPKALAAVTVYVFEMPRSLPPSDETDGVVDWAVEKREALPGASVEVQPMKDGAAIVHLCHVGEGVFKADSGDLPEGFVNVVAHCPGYMSEEKAVMLLVGANDLYLPLRKAAEGPTAPPFRELDGSPRGGPWRTLGGRAPAKDPWGGVAWHSKNGCLTSPGCCPSLGSISSTAGP